MGESEIEQFIVKIKGLARVENPIFLQIKYPRALVNSLRELDNVVGMTDTKRAVISMISTCMIEKNKGTYEMGNNNILLTGPPGVGKTTVAYILGKIVNAIGILNDSYANEIASPRDISGATSIGSMPSMTQYNFFTKLTKDRALNVSKDVENMKKKNGLYWSYIRELGDINIRIEALLNESSSYTTRYKSTGLDENLRAAESRNVEALKCCRNINDRIKNIDVDLKNRDKITIVDTPVSRHISEDEWGDDEAGFKNIFIHATRSTLVAGYVGHTAPKTLEVISRAASGVLFVDEAYSLVNTGRDGSGNDFGPESLAEITNEITKHPDKTLYIFAGYKKLIEDTIFKVQRGLDRRFAWKFDITEYSAPELAKIFTGMIQKTGWLLDPDLDITSFFDRHFRSFTAFGGDCKNLCYYCRVIMAEKELDSIIEVMNSAEQTYLNMIDDTVLNTALTMMLENKSDKVTVGLPDHLKCMYN